MAEAARSPDPEVQPRHVFRWDLDKTYLRTDFDSFRGLVRTAMETAQDKRAYPGASALLRALGKSDEHRICIVSGSPKQMRRVLAAKLALDGIRFDEFVLKDNLRNIARGRFRAIRSQVPYKLPALLNSRRQLVSPASETLFGDDAEADAIIYSLYGDILSGDVSISELERILMAARAYDDEIRRTLDLARRLPTNDSVRRILIHLDRRSPTALFTPFGRRLVPIYNYFQGALILYADGLLSVRQVLFVALEMLKSPEHELATLANSLQDLLRRGRLTIDTAQRLALEAKAIGTTALAARMTNLPPIDDIAWAFALRVTQLGDAPPLEWPDADPKLNYVDLVDNEHQQRQRKR